MLPGPMRVPHGILSPGCGGPGGGIAPAAPRPRAGRGERRAIGVGLVELRSEAAVAPREDERVDRLILVLGVDHELEALRQQRADHQLERRRTLAGDGRAGRHRFRDISINLRVDVEERSVAIQLGPPVIWKSCS